MANIVELKNVSVSYREDVALKDVSLTVDDGEFVGILGPNGAGKTTLLNVINGFGRILSGRISVFGEQLSRRNKTLVRKQIGYVPQILNIDARMPFCVRDVVMMGRYGQVGLLKRLTKEDWQVVFDVMNLVGISSLADKPIGHLSGGEGQKVAIARALAQQPKILLLDEPTSSLDLSSQANIIDLIETIYQRSKLTIFWVTHELSQIPRSCNKLVLMKSGRIFFAGKKEETLKEEMLAELYECPIKRLNHDGRVFIYPRREINDEDSEL